jgi:hypothetical protein
MSQSPSQPSAADSAVASAEELLASADAASLASLMAKTFKAMTGSAAWLLLAQSINPSFTTEREWAALTRLAAWREKEIAGRAPSATGSMVGDTDHPIFKIMATALSAPGEPGQEAARRYAQTLGSARWRSLGAESTEHWESKRLRAHADYSRRLLRGLEKGPKEPDVQEALRGEMCQAIFCWLTPAEDYATASWNSVTEMARLAEARGLLDAKNAALWVEEISRLVSGQSAKAKTAARDEAKRTLSAAMALDSPPGMDRLAAGLRAALDAPVPASEWAAALNGPERLARFKELLADGFAEGAEPEKLLRLRSLRGVARAILEKEAIAEAAAGSDPRPKESAGEEGISRGQPAGARLTRSPLKI